jgi:DNA processing protein
MSESAITGTAITGTVVSDEVLLARAYLSRVSEPACVAVWALVREVGPVQAAAMIRASEVDSVVRDETAARRRAVDPEGDLEAAQRLGIRLVTPETADWPHFGFAALEHSGDDRLRNPGAKRDRSGELIPPLALWVKGSGDLPKLGLRSVGIVGSRAATGYGEFVSAELAYGLAQHGFDVVSGGAYGIDAAAHRAALAAGGSTVIISAGGLDRPYPVGNASLYDSAATDGLVISESPPGSAPQRQRFLTRNRLIAALSTGTVVVEAARRSGALNTAGHCRLLGRALMVVPGPVTSAMSAGCHDLLRSEHGYAVLVETVDHVLALIGSSGEGIALEVHGSDPDALRAALDQLDPIARRVFEGLPGRGAVSEDRLAVLAGVELRSVMTAIPSLRLLGLVEIDLDGVRVATPVRKALRGDGAVACDAGGPRAP